jgi:hypothetical protein
MPVTEVLGWIVWGFLALLSLGFSAEFRRIYQRAGELMIPMRSVVGVWILILFITLLVPTLRLHVLWIAPLASALVAHVSLKTVVFESVGRRGIWSLGLPLVWIGIFWGEICLIGARRHAYTEDPWWILTDELAGDYELASVLGIDPVTRMKVPTETIRKSFMGPIRCLAGVLEAARDDDDLPVPTASEEIIIMIDHMNGSGYLDLDPVHTVNAVNLAIAQGYSALPGAKRPQLLVLALLCARNRKSAEEPIDDYVKNIGPLLTAALDRSPAKELLPLAAKKLTGQNS